MKAYCLLNHSLTEKQQEELKTYYKCTEIIYPNYEISKNWSQISTDREQDKEAIHNIATWLNDAMPSDILIIQGEFGMTFTIVDYALKHCLIPVHAVTKRVECEEINGEIVNRHYVFQHVCFREYRYYRD